LEKRVRATLHSSVDFANINKDGTTKDIGSNLFLPSLEEYLGLIYVSLV